MSSDKDFILKNQREHEQDCYISCESYYCATAGDTFSKNITEILGEGTEIRSYSMGSVPPEDFADQFGFPLDLIKVTGGIPLFSREEADFIIKQAEAEGIEQNEYRSGKYKLGGDWLTNLPKTREWFNQILETKLFPLLCHLFPEVISSPSVLRAHSVSLLKYNSSHPRTDVHIDNGILAMTLAMTPRDQYVGGGTFFEHFDTVLPMDVGHATLRPGSVRHGGHPVTEGTRYILGAFLLIKDRVEHVRRLKNRGSDLRKAGALEDAIRHFQWALALNPKCTTCLKDWAEILYAQGSFADAEGKLQLALTLLEEKDSDAFFSLGQVLSAQGRDDESIAAYTRSFQLNADDAELVYNLGIKLGERGDKEKENEMYAKATSISPTFGGAWLNWGTNLAEVGKFDDASLMFQKAMTCGPDVQPKAMINLAIIHHRTTSLKIDGGDYAGAKVEAKYASELLDNAKPLLDRLHQIGDTEAGHFLQQFKPLRLQCHRNLAQLYAGAGDFSGCEAELSAAVTNFPEEPMALHMLKRILDIQGKVKESENISQRIAALTGSSTN
jgi:tetratricopeptide (TPR) repeat protein